MSQFPPQAYTRDILATAYEWLRGQPQSVREMAQDSDSLVALYMQHRRRSDQQMAQPSSEAFKQDLKNLAEGLKQFDDPQKVRTHKQNSPSMLDHLQMEAQIQQTQAQWQAQQIQQQVNQHSSVHVSQNQMQYTTQEQVINTTHKSSASSIRNQGHVPPPHQQNYPSHLHAATQVPEPIQQNWPQTPKPKAFTEELDYKTVQKIRDLQERFNLSHENEAIRMLIALGLEQMEKILPKK